MHKLFTPQRRQYRTKFYKTTQWVRIRNNQLRKAALCEHCLNSKPRRLTVATVCDHKNPDWTTFKEFCIGPFQSLCDACHRQKTSFYDIPYLIKKQRTKQVILDV